MKTAEEKAINLITVLSSRFDKAMDIYPDLVILLKEQDRDTRRACVEAVSSCDSEIDEDGGAELICASDARSAIMNTKAV